MRFAKLTLHSPVWDVKPEEKGAPINWVELKTSVEPVSPKDMENFERKLMKFWIQSFLLGVPKIIVGFRDRRGMLLKLEELETVSIPDTVKRRGRSWDGNVCINAASAFLECEHSISLFHLVFPLFSPFLFLFIFFPFPPSLC